MLLELDVAVLVLSQIEEQFLNFIAKSNGIRVIGHEVEPPLNFVDESIRVFLVSILEEITTLVLESVPFIRCLVLEDVPSLAKTLADVSIDSLGPIVELGITVCVVDEIGCGIEDIVHGGTVGKDLEESPELDVGFLEVTVFDGTYRFTVGVLSDIRGVADIFLRETDECIDRLHVVLVLLDFDNHLLQTSDRLIATFLGDLVVEIIPGPIAHVVLDVSGSIFVLVGDSV